MHLPVHLDSLLNGLVADAVQHLEAGDLRGRAVTANGDPIATGQGSAAGMYCPKQVLELRRQAGRVAL